MGEARATSSLLLPGVRFYPSEEELLGHYLSGKNADSGGARPEGHDLIGELDLYGYDPFELPESACYAYGVGGKKKHWFCYTGDGAGRERGGKRRANNGYWRRKGRVRVVLGRGGRGALGTRTKFTFYLVNSTKDAVRTNWVLYEYAPLHHLKASFVLCRVFVKSRPRNSISENGLVSCAEESVSAVRNIGIQHDGDNISIENDDNAVDDQIVAEPDPMGGIQLPLCSELDAPDSTMEVLEKLVRLDFCFLQKQTPFCAITSISKHTTALFNSYLSRVFVALLHLERSEDVTVANTFFLMDNDDAFTADHLLAILNGDFLEMDDLRG